mmetsp:Transcript_7586/g.15584  ORF Transcript_7586/g.15584 Transcript_7586/m.15584 type:complete len:200 (+) Transcript_7586:454-1053(+)
MVCGFHARYGAGPYSGDTNTSRFRSSRSLTSSFHTPICRFRSRSHSGADGSAICGPCAHPNRAWMYSHFGAIDCSKEGHHWSRISSLGLKTRSQAQYQWDRSALSFRCSDSNRANKSRVWKGLPKRRCRWVSKVTVTASEEQVSPISWQQKPKKSTASSLDQASTPACTFMKPPFSTSFRSSLHSRSCFLKSSRCASIS